MAAVWALYTVQGDKSDNGSMNAFMVEGVSMPAGAKSAPQLTLAQVADSFPLRHAGSYHYRFKVAKGQGHVFMDLSNPNDRVPLFNGAIHMKVLRLDGLQCATQRRDRRLKIRPMSSRPHAGGAAAAAVEMASAGATASTVPPRSGSSGRLGASRAASQATARRTPSASPPPPSRRLSGDDLHVSRARSMSPAGDPRRPDPLSRARNPELAAVAGGTGAAKAMETAAGAATAPVPTRPMAAGAAAGHGGASTDVAPPPKPEFVDDDLKGKSEFVQAAVMARRNKLKADQNAALAAVKAREEKKKEEESDRDTAQAMLGPKLDAWRAEASGQLRDIRSLVTTLHTVLWEGANWTEVPMSKIIMAPRVRIYYLKACAVVHPDKHMTAGPERKYIAERIFEALNEAHRKFQENPV